MIFITLLYYHEITKNTTTPQLSDKKDEIKQKVLNYSQIAKSSKEIKKYIGFSSKTYVAENIIKPLIKVGMLKYTNNKSINARNQKYITVKK